MEASTQAVSCNFDTISIDSTVTVKENGEVMKLILWCGDVGQLNPCCSDVSSCFRTSENSDGHLQKVILPPQDSL